MKNILVVSGCPMRGDTTGLIGHFLNALEDIDKDAFSISLFDIGFFDKKHNPNDYPVNKYYGLPVYKIETIIRKIPRLRSWYAERLIINTFRRLIKNNNFDWVIFYHIPVFADIMIKIAHSKRVKVVFYPWGSEILRVDNKTHNRLLKSFSEVDFVVGIEKSNTIIAAQKQYNVPSDRIKCIRPYHYGVRMLMNVKDKLPKDVMLERAKKNCSAFQNITFVSADITALDYPDGTFDKVVAGNVLHLLDDPLQALSQLNRVCKKGGQLILPTYMNREQKGEAGRFISMVDRAGAGFRRQFTPESYRAFFRMAGYPDVQIMLANGRIPCAVAVMRKKEDGIMQSGTELSGRDS